MSFSGLKQIPHCSQRSKMLIGFILLLQIQHSFRHLSKHRATSDELTHTILETSLQAGTSSARLRLA